MRIRAVVDRFEDTKAVLLVGDAEASVIWPRAFLPEGTGEGDILSLALSLDGEATRAARAEAEDLLRKLLDSGR
ncbi:DUF3006 domain-containing protein [Anaeroselena agilis]|uniref:DUF3006 domain-containing protein n=1 Tax=Anaeroselena agilis TaxID=3063788 RepID=A0ABU3NUV9_9FIRM|nr:DUF3006 domain-containing protein [Selenomonadales bacterium 4137-cl]